MGLFCSEVEAFQLEERGSVAIGIAGDKPSRGYSPRICRRGPSQDDLLDVGAGPAKEALGNLDAIGYEMLALGAWPAGIRN